ncbi:MAG: AMP-binding protein [Gemmataceae bacterium]
MLLFKYLFWLFTRFILSLRYRVTIHGAEQLQDLEGPILLLPNHPGFIDPMLIYANFWGKFRTRPLMSEATFKNPIMSPVMTLVDAVPLPDLKQINAEARERAEATIQSIMTGLKSGKNYALWPAGRIQREGKEVIGGAKALSDIIQAVPEANLVVARTRGLWGSRFGFAQTGQFPSLVGGILAGIGWCLASLILFLPRRKVDITLHVVDRNELPEPVEPVSQYRQQINQWFEDWYNALGAEEPKFVPYHHFLGARTFDFPEYARVGKIDLDRIQPATKQAVAQLLAEKLGRPLSEDENQPEVTLDELGLDSLGRMDLALDIERQFGHACDQVPADLGHIWSLAQGLQHEDHEVSVPEEWFAPATGDLTGNIVGETIPESFVSRALANPKDVIVADDMSGVFNYEKLLIGALMMSKQFGKLEGKNVGLMLPASVGSDLSLLGLQLAGKLPVLLNWTTGPGNLEHSAKLMELQYVITSRVFVNRLHIDIPGVEFVFLEDVKKEIGTFDKLRTLLTVRWAPGTIRQSIPQPSPDDTAVVLFTSGSEKAPKAVPLTHANLFTVLRGGLARFELTRNDSFLGFLPAFHSFGMTITGLLPILSGIRVVRHPNPTESAKLARKIKAYKPTLILGTPTFVAHILERARPGELESLRIVVVGAEKCPPTLFEKIREVTPHTSLYEGYGITECSPAVTVNGPKFNRPGTVGQALPGVELCVVDLETDEVLPPGQQGMLLVHGPNVFSGYIGHDAPQPFRELNGKRWYVTGDLVELDQEGAVTFKGRLKRFLKAGGEMISLPALEEPFSQLYPPTEDGPQVAVEGCETEAGTRVVLFSTQPLTLADANTRLKDAGFHGVMRFSEVRQVEAIPTIGPSKIDYKQLRKQVERDYGTRKEEKEKVA